MKSNVASPLHVLVTSLLVILSEAQDFIMLPKAQDFDFFYFVQEWHASYCDTKQSCCYPTTGKPHPDFGIHGLWPNYNNGSYPSDCDTDNPFNPSEWPGSSCDTKQGCCYPTSGKPAADFSIRGHWPNNNDGSSPSNCNPNSHFNPSQDLSREMQANWPILTCPSSNGFNSWSYEWKKHRTCSESVLNQQAYFQAALNLKKQANLLQILKNAGTKPDGGFYSLSNISEAIRMATGYMPGIQCNVNKGKNHQLYRIYQCADTFGSKFIDCPGMPLLRCSSQIKFPSF